MAYSYKVQLQNKIPRDGRTKHPLYSTWSNMMRRCYDIDNTEYHVYGGRGISVSEEWEDFWVFVNDIGPKQVDTSLDRIDNNKGYSKENCKWSSRKEQQCNTTKFKGFTIWKEVHPTKNYHRWRAKISKPVYGKVICSKSFRTEEEALQWVTELSLLNTSPMINLEKYNLKL